MIRLLKRLATSLGTGAVAAAFVLLLAQLDTKVETGADAMNEVFVTSAAVAWLWQTYRTKAPGPLMKVVIALAAGALAGAACSFLPLNASIDSGFAVISAIFIGTAAGTWLWLASRKPD